MMSQDDKSDKSDDCMLEQSASKTLSNKVTHDSSLSPSTSWMLSMCCCFKDPSDKQAAYIIFASVLHFLAIGLTSVALKLLINKRIAGDAQEPNSESAFVDTTNVFIHAFMSFCFGRYTSGLGDYLGRKPMLILSSLAAIFTRLVYLHSMKPGGFYFAAFVGGGLDCFYFSALAWICDLYPEGRRRSKRVGLFVGIVGGLALTIGAPLGAVIATYDSPSTPFIIAPFVSVLCIMFLIILPVDDTIGIQKEIHDIVRVWGNRGVPANIRDYLKVNFPISFGSLVIIQRAKYPVDWVTNFLMHICTSTLSMIIIQFCLGVFDWSAPVASAAVLSIGLCLGIFAPSLLHRFNPVPLAFYMMTVFTIGLALMSVAGTGLSIAPLLGVIGIICMAVSTSWVPSLQTNLTNQYGQDVQGLVSGLLGQQNDLSMLPAYVISLGFTLSLRREGSVYWPGSSFGAAAFIGLISICLHYSIYKSEATHLSRRVSSTTTASPTERESMVVMRAISTELENGVSSQAVSPFAEEQNNATPPPMESKGGGGEV